MHIKTNVIGAGRVPPSYVITLYIYYFILLSYYVHSFVSAAPDSMEVDGEDGRVDLASLQRTFCREFTSLYLKMADTARLQCNYAVSKRYLQLTEAAIGEVTVKCLDVRLSCSW